MPDMTDVYIQLSYRDYKELEDQLVHYKQIETSHESVRGFYHKAFRLKVGSITFEFQGPLVKEPYREDTGQEYKNPIPVQQTDEEIL